MESAAEHMLERIKKDIEIQKTEPHPIDFALLGKLTPQDVARNIIHVAPEVPFILDGVAYDPEDIHRFNGQALVFVPIVAADGSKWLQVFHDDIAPVLAAYFQMQQIASLISPTDWNYPGVGNSPQVPPYPPPTPNREPSGPPFTRGQIQMFDDADYRGNWFWLAKNYIWMDLRRVSRGGFFGGDWNDKISSLSNTDTYCIYCEAINLEGSKLVLGPNQPNPYLTALGWNDRISSVWCFYC